MKKRNLILTVLESEKSKSIWLASGEGFHAVITWQSVRQAMKDKEGGLEGPNLNKPTLMVTNARSI